MDRKNHQKNNSGLPKNRESIYSSNFNNSNNNLNCDFTKKGNSSEVSKSINTNISTNYSENNQNKSNNNHFIEDNKSSNNINDNEIQIFPRSIKSKYDESEISNQYSFLDFYPCVECQMPIDLYSICRNFKDMNKDLEWALCSNCNTKILPKLRIKYLDKQQDIDCKPVFNIRKGSCSSLNSDHYNCDESEVLYSPFHLKYNFYNSSFIENRLKLDIDYFKIKFNALFWNSVWYFKIKELPYDFISPYSEQTVVRLKLKRQISDPKNTIDKIENNQILKTCKNGFGTFNQISQNNLKGKDDYYFDDINMKTEENLLKCNINKNEKEIYSDDKNSYKENFSKNSYANENKDNGIFSK